MFLHQPRPSHKKTGLTARLAEFRKRDVADGMLLTNAIVAGKSLDGHPRKKLLVGSIDFYNRGIAPNSGKVCIACKVPFAAGAAWPGAYLVSIPATAAASSAAVSGICGQCWRSRSDAEIDHAATCVLRRLIPRGRFLDSWPPSQETCR